MNRNLLQRILFAVVAIPVALLVVWYGGVALVLLVAVAAVLGTRELVAFARRQGLAPVTPAAALLAAALPALAWAATVSPAVAQAVQRWWAYGAALFVLAILIATLARLAPDQKPLGSAAVTLLAPLYAAGLPAFLLPIRHAGYPDRSVEGAALVFFPLVCVWICDTAAMTVGRRLGGRKLAPTVSPGKTWSGTIGGFVGALAVAPLYAQLVFRPLGIDVPLAAALLLAALIGALGQVGDLVESLFKREAGLKDSSTLIPGHGGVLDRLDSLYFAIPLAAVIFKWAGVL